MQALRQPQPDAAPYAEIGNMLRQAREEMRMTTLQAAHALHIRTSYLESLESGHFDQLPGLAYTKGYLQSYAAFLQLDKDEILRQFEHQEAALRRGFYLPQGISREKTPTQTAMWGGLAAAAVVYGLWLLISSAPFSRVSVVDAIPQQAHAKAEYFHNPACFKPKAKLYPPCYEIWVKETPRKRPVKSVMDLAQ